MPSIVSIRSLLILPLTAVFVALYVGSAARDNAFDFLISNTNPVRGFYSVTASVSEVSVRDDSTCTNTTYLGISHNAVEQYLNIFYAQDTSGRNRFAPPVPLPCESNSVVDARSYGAWCPQGTGPPPLPFTSPIINISENCLSLGITRPSGTSAGDNLPVIVWIHGGGHALGSYADQLYDPTRLVRGAKADGKPIIFVGINYRLGMFGFARSKALSAVRYTNAGLRDQRAAFEWIEDHITAFGGDAGNIVSLGQSVGASDTGLHITSYGGARGVPFHKAVMMSGAPGLTFNIYPADVEERTASVAESLGCVDDGDSQSKKTMECLQQAPMSKLMNLSVSASRQARPPFGEAFFHPTHDGDYIPDRPSELLRQGRCVRDIPVIASWVTNEGAWYAPPTTESDQQVTDSFGLWISNLSPTTLSKLLELYPITDFEGMAASDTIGGLSPQYYRAAQMNRDLWFTCPSLDFVHQYAQHSSATSPLPRIYMYEHNTTRFTPIFKNIMHVPFWGVSHLSDIPYMLNNDVAAGGDNSRAARALAKEMSGFLLSFAYSGNPGKRWPKTFRQTNLRQSPDRGLPEEFNMMLFQSGLGDTNHYGEAITVRKSGEQGNRSVSRATDLRIKAVEWENLFARCDFINSEKVREEIGV